MIANQATKEGGFYTKGDQRDYIKQVLARIHY